MASDAPRPHRFHWFHLSDRSTATTDKQREIESPIQHTQTRTDWHNRQNQEAQDEEDDPNRPINAA